ncbi:MAG: hypothetical protein Q8S94_11060 [Pseudohongiella sp.]|nr:hypothetical protein [Pseudohongiella sp.]
MQVAVNSKGIPIELKFKIKNIFNFPVQLYFPRDKDAFAKGIYIVGADNFGYKPREMAGKPISETFEYFGLTPNEEMIWEYEVEDLVLSFDEHIKMRGFVRVSFASLLYLDKDNSGIENFMNFERLRARVTWNGDIKQ